MLARTLIGLLFDRRGATAIEYGLVAAFLAVGIIVLVSLLGGEVVEMFDNTATVVAAE